MQISNQIQERQNINDDQQNIRWVDVPGDGSCLFWSTALAYLIPVKDNDNLFAERYERLFGNGVPQHLEDVRSLIRNNNVDDNMLAGLIRHNFRNRVVDYIRDHENQFRGFIEGNFQNYLRDMRNPNNWGDEPEIRAMSEMLSANIIVHSGGEVIPHDFGDVQINLLHTGPQGQRNHYKFGLDRNLLDPNAVKSLEESLNKYHHFELIQLLIEELDFTETSNIGKQRGDFDSFQARFQSFIDQIPSYLHSVKKDGFFTHFFLGSFSVVLDTKIAEKLDVKKIYFSFGSAKTLKLAVMKGEINNLEDVIKKVKLLVISEKQEKNPNTKSRGDDPDRKFRGKELINLWDTPPSYIDDEAIREIENKMKVKLVEIKKSSEEISVNVEDENMGYGEDEKKVYKFKEIKRGLWNKPEDDIANLSNPNRNRVLTYYQGLLNEISKIHREYKSSLYSAIRAREAADHGFISGVFMNFRYRYNLRIYLEQFAGRGYADIILLARGPDRSTNSIPIIIEVKAGGSSVSAPDRALRQAETYARGFQPNVMRVLTTADSILYVGVNFDHASPVSEVQSLDRDMEIVPIFEDILVSSNRWCQMRSSYHELEHRIRDNLQRIHHTFPGTAEKSDNHYFSRYLLGQLLLLDRVDALDTGFDKHIFSYNEVVPTETHPTSGREQRPAAQVSRERMSAGLDSSHAIVTIVLIPRSAEKLVYVINIGEANRKVVGEEIVRVPLENLGRQIENRKIFTLDLNFNLHLTGKARGSGIHVYVEPNYYSSLSDYNNRVNVALRGDFVHLPYHRELREAFDRALDYRGSSAESLELSQPSTIDRYRGLLQRVGVEIFPFRSQINSESNFQAVLHGVFSHYSDLKLNESPENRLLVLTEFQTGRGDRIDMLIQRVKFSGQNEEYTPIGLELKISRDARNVQAALREAEDDINKYYKKGVTYKTLTDGSEVKFIAVAFNRGASNENSPLILTSSNEITVTVVHSSIISNPKNFIVENVLHSSLTDSHEVPNISVPRKKSRLDPCLVPKHRKKRSLIDCLFSWRDIDRFNLEKVQNRNIDKIRIDPKKFLIHLKNSQNKERNAQLIEFVSNKNIAKEGEHEYLLLNEVVRDGGYEQHSRNSRIQELGNDILYQESGSRVKNHKLRNRLINAAGVIQLIRGVHGAIISCKDGTKEDCGLSLGAIGWSFASQPIANVMVRAVPKAVETSSRIAVKVIPGVLGKQVGFAIKFTGAKYGAKMARGAAGAVAGAFDIIFIGISAKNLIDCKDREDSDNACGKQEIRDNIASISFSGVSFVSGIALTSAGATLGVSVAVGSVIMVSQGVYSGVSNIIEYKEKYDTTSGEDWSVFWRTALLQDMAQDVKHLKSRTEIVNSQTKLAKEALIQSAKEVFAYGIGFGEDRVEPNLDTGYAKILMNVTNANTDNLSRVIPEAQELVKCHKVQKRDSATNSMNLYRNHYCDTSDRNDFIMICLPQATQEIYEKDIKKSVPTAVHHCENSMVIADKRRMNGVGNTILYNLKNIDRGIVVGSSDYNNDFLIFKGNTQITGGNNVINKFVIFDGNFVGSIYGGKNATNVFILSELKKYNNIKVSINYLFKSNAPGFLSLKVNHYQLTKDYVDGNVDAFRYSYIGRRNKIDNVSCTYNSRRLTSNDNRSVSIDSGGGLSKNEKDIVDNCKKVAILPYTKVTGAENDYTFYIQSTDYRAKDLYSEIDVEGTGTVFFPEINLLDDCDEISYFSTNNTLSLKIGLGQDNQYTLDIKNYIKQSSNQPNFILIDKNGSNIVPKLESSITKVSSFELHAKYSLESLYDAENYYKTILSNNKGYKVLGVVREEQQSHSDGIVREKRQSNNPFQSMVFGSSAEDIINFDQRGMFVKGGNGSDIYVVDNNTDRRNFVIDNKSGDKELDVLVIPEVPEKFSIQSSNLYLDYSNTRIQILNYLQSNSYRHLMVMNSRGEVFIPYIQSMSCSGSLIESSKLVHFFHATQTQNMFFLSKDFQGNHVVVDSRLEDIKRYKDKDDLLLIREDEIPFLIRIEDFYNYRSKWEGINFLLWQDGNFFPYLGLQQEVSEVMNYQDKLKTDYERIIKEYIIDFYHSISITHNQNDILTSLGQDEERIGVMILKNVTPDRIRVSSSDADLIFSDKVSGNVIRIKNWNNSESYRISTLEFDLGLEPLIIRRLDKFSLSNIAEIQELISEASEICNKKSECETNIEVKNNDGQTLFHIAAQEGKLHTIKLLIDKIESMNFEDSLYSGTDQLIKAVLQRERLKSLISEKDRFGYTPLQYAAKNSNWDIVNLFFDKTAERSQDDVAGKDEYSQSWNTLHYAVYSGNLNLLKDIFPSLLDKKNIINTRDNGGWTPLHYSAYYVDLDMFTFLLNEGADINAKDNEGKTPIDVSSQGFITVLSQLLLDKEFLITLRRSDDIKKIENLIDQGARKDRSDIYYYVWSGNLDKVKVLFERSLGVSGADKYESTLLHWAALKGHSDIARFLIDKGANVSAKDILGRTPTHFAVINNHVDIIEFLLKQGASVNEADRNGWTSLHYAAGFDQLDSVRFLIEKGADFNTADKDGYTPLESACMLGQLDIVKYLVGERKADFNIEDKDGYTPLESACMSGQLDIVKYLVEEKEKKGKIDFSIKGKHGHTLLHIASESGQLNILKYLIEVKKADLNVQDKDGYTPLESACVSGQLNVVKYLIEKSKVDSNVKNKSGSTLLHLAALNGKLNMVRYLIEERKDDFYTAYKDGYTLLESACMSGHLDIVKYLITKKEKEGRIDFSIKGIRGHTLLHIASENGQLNILEYLIEVKKADLNVEDQYGHTPLEAACMSGQLNVVKYLIEKSKVDSNVKNKYGNVLLQLAYVNRKFNIVKYLIEENYPVSLTRYQPDREHGLQISRDRDSNIGLVDLRDKSILDFNIEIIGDSLVLLYKGNPFVKIENWNVKQPKREMILLFSNAQIFDRKCMYFNCDPRGIIKEFNKVLDFLKNNPNTQKYIFSSEIICKTIEERKPCGWLEGPFTSKCEPTGFLSGYYHVVEREECAPEVLSKNEIYLNQTRKIAKRSTRQFVTSSASRSTSFINTIASTVTNAMMSVIQGVSQLISFKPSVNQASSSHRSSQYIQASDINSTLLLLDVFIRKITGEKYISLAEQSISESQARDCALSITDRFEQVLRKSTKTSGCATPQLDFHWFNKLFRSIEGSMISGQYSKVPRMLYESAKNICDDPSEKFLRNVERNIEKMLNDISFEKRPTINSSTPLSSLSNIDIEPVNRRRAIG